MPVPVVLSVRIRTQRAETTGNRDESIKARGDTLVHGGVAHIEQRFPVLWSTRLHREPGILSKPIFDGAGVAKDQRRLQRRCGNARMNGEESIRATYRTAGGAADEFIDRRVE